MNTSMSSRKGCFMGSEVKANPDENACAGAW